MGLSDKFSQESIADLMTCQQHKVIQLLQSKAQNYNMLQAVQINSQVKLILNCIQLSIYVVIICFSIYKCIRSHQNHRDFLLKFYTCVSCVIAIEIGIQAYQISALADQQQPIIYIFAIINLYAITAESITIFQLSDYWHETSQIITKQSSEFEVNQEKHWIRYLLVGIWIIAFSAFVGFGVVQDSFQSSKLFQTILALGCQGLGVIILTWAILLQVWRGRKLANAIGRYEQWLNSISIKTLQFNCLYLVTTICNLCRVTFLIIVTIIMVIYHKDIHWEWLAAYIYTVTNCIVLSIYIFCFSTKPQIEKTTLLSGVQEQQYQRRSHDSSRSRHETQLSSSASHHSH